MATTRLVVFPSIIFESYKRKAQSYPGKLYPKAARITILQALETFETSAGMYMQKDEMNESALKKKFRVVASSAGMLQFLLLTLAIYFALDQLYKYLLADSALMSNYVAFLANSASSLLSLVGLEHEVGIFEARSYRIGTKFGAYIDIKMSFTEHTFYTVLIAAIAAWPGSWLRKTGFIAIGLLLLTALNIFRCVCMLLIDIHVPLSFDLFNIWILPGAFTLFLFFYFLVWTKFSKRYPLDTIR